MDKKIILLGYSGHAYSVIEAAYSCGQNIAGYCDISSNRLNPFNLDYLGIESELNINEILKHHTFFPSVGNLALREKLLRFIEQNNGSALNIIHKNASISERAEIMGFVFISNGCVINPLSKIGKGTIINTGAIVEHECIIKDNCHIAPGATLAGNVQIGKNTFIGANATLIQGVKVGSNVTVGAGAVVIKDIADGMKHVGNPAKKIQNNTTSINNSRSRG